MPDLAEKSGGEGQVPTIFELNQEQENGVVLGPVTLVRVIHDTILRLRLTSEERQSRTITRRLKLLAPGDAWLHISRAIQSPEGVLDKIGDVELGINALQLCAGVFDATHLDEIHGQGFGQFIVSGIVEAYFEQADERTRQARIRDGKYELRVAGNFAMSTTQKRAAIRAVEVQPTAQLPDIQELDTTRLDPERIRHLLQRTYDAGGD